MHEVEEKNYIDDEIRSVEVLALQNSDLNHSLHRTGFYCSMRICGFLRIKRSTRL